MATTRSKGNNMSKTASISQINRLLHFHKVVRKPSTNEYVVKVIGSRSDDLSYFTNDLADALSTAVKMDKQMAAPARKPKKSPYRRSKSRPTASRSRRTSRISSSLDAFSKLSYLASLYQGSKCMMTISASQSQYMRVLAATDIWNRGGSMEDVERAAGSHTNVGRRIPGLNSKD